jgi:hypothetical protein
MAFYDLPKEQRKTLVAKIEQELLQDIKERGIKRTARYFKNADTYIRKSLYLSVGRVYFANNSLQKGIIQLLEKEFDHHDFRVRQTVINAAGEIGKREFEKVVHFFDEGLNDLHHAPRNAVIGSIKKMGEVNPKPGLKNTCIIPIKKYEERFAMA